MSEAVELERAVMICPQCEGEGTYADGIDEDACSTLCTRCGGNGWIVDLSALRAKPAEGEPVAWRWRHTKRGEDSTGWSVTSHTPPKARPEGAEQWAIEVQPLYTRPVSWPDREAVARAIGAAAGVSWADGVVTYASTPEDDGPLERFYRAAADILALLSASDGAGQVEGKKE